MPNLNQKLLDFIACSPTAFHAVETVRQALIKDGYQELLEGESWSLTLPGKYFVRRNGSSLAAFHLPGADIPGFQLYAAHTDSPAFKIKPQPQTTASGLYTQLSIEKYGGAIFSTWMDRPLSIAGRVLVREGDVIATKLVDFHRDMALIPNVAIHMDRKVNEGKALNPNVDLLPLLGPAKCRHGFSALVAKEAGVSEDDLLSTELYLYLPQKGVVWGEGDCYVSAPRLDDLQCVFSGLTGLLSAKPQKSGAVLCLFDNEEVGSGTKQGAGSNFLEQTLQRIWLALGRSAADYPAALANSFMVSADNAHALHPNHGEYADRNDRPALNEGIVLKYHAEQKYTTDGLSAAVFTELCKRAGVLVQRFSNRADLPGGSTLGNISSAHVSVNTVDIGLAQLAMHSAYETAGAKDTADLIRAAKALFESSFGSLDGDRFHL